jgi:HSP20 family protein
MHPHFNREHFAHAMKRKFFGGRNHRWPVRPKYNVPVNIEETTDWFEVSVYATGFEKQNIRISVTGNQLLISGTREIDESKLPEFVSQEFPVRVFERTILLSEHVDANGITARQENGILYIRLPKTEIAKTPPQEVQIS